MATTKHDPNKLFVVSTVSRRSIARALNDAIDNAASPVRKFKVADPRLTDKVCQDVAAILHEISLEGQADDVEEVAFRSALDNLF